LSSFDNLENTTPPVTGPRADDMDKAAEKLASLKGTAFRPYITAI
jgi:hypothetical protein